MKVPSPVAIQVEIFIVGNFNRVFSRRFVISAQLLDCLKETRLAL